MHFSFDNDYSNFLVYSKIQYNLDGKKKAQSLVQFSSFIIKYHSERIITLNYSDKRHE